jgi:dethiobiotin synthetase
MGAASGVRGVVVVTGTDTGVGKTVVTAAIAATASAAGLRVAVVKPGQTGIRPGAAEESDVDVVRRLANPALARTLATYPHPLAPLAAARTSGLPPLELTEVIAAIRECPPEHDLVLVEGAGGLLVPMGPTAAGLAWTVADLSTELAARAVVVARAGLGTLNHTALTLEALAQRGIEALLVIGAWPAEPELVHRTNMVDLRGELAGAVPDGAGRLAPTIFRASAPSWLSPTLHGRFDPDRFRAWAPQG